MISINQSTLRPGSQPPAAPVGRWRSAMARAQETQPEALGQVHLAATIHQEIGIQCIKRWGKLGFAFEKLGILRNDEELNLPKMWNSA